MSRPFFLLAGVAVIGVAAGCGSSTKTHTQTAGPHVEIIASKSGRLLHGRRLAVSVGSSEIRDTWVLSHGRLIDVSKSVRIKTGGTGCYGSAYGSGSGPCYQYAEPFALSRDGKQLAFVLGFPVEGENDMPDALIVSRSNGSHAREVRRLDVCALCSVSTPSWDKDSRSFVLSVESFPNMASLRPIWRIVRVNVRSGRVFMLSPPGKHTYSESQPAVSPDGGEIAFLRGVRPGPADVSNGAAALVYEVSAKGGRRVRLPLPPRGYVDLWWCGSSTLLCVDSPTQTLDARANVYQLNLQTGRVTNRRRWAEASNGGLSPDGTFAMSPRKTPYGWKLLVGPVGASGLARLAPVLTTRSRQDPFWEFSVSEPQAVH